MSAAEDRAARELRAAVERAALPPAVVSALLVALDALDDARTAPETAAELYADADDRARFAELTAVGAVAAYRDVLATLPAPVTQ